MSKIVLTIALFDDEEDNDFPSAESRADFMCAHFLDADNNEEFPFPFALHRGDSTEG